MCVRYAEGPGTEMNQIRIFHGKLDSFNVRASSEQKLSINCFQLDLKRSRYLKSGNSEKKLSI